MATTTDTDRDGQPVAPSPEVRTAGDRVGGRGQRPDPDPTPSQADTPIPEAAPRRRRDGELKAIEHALQVLDGDTQAIAATSACLSALAAVEDPDRRASIVALLGLEPAGMKLAKVVLEDRWTRNGEAG
jgi:hypothetical protein